MKLTPAQAEAFPWVIERPRALLGAGAGLGKTRVAIDAFCYRRLMGDASVLLVFGPKAVINLSWPDEIAKWAPELTVQNLATDCRWTGADVYLINYERIRHLIKLIQESGEFPPDSIVLDECHSFGNPSAIRQTLLKPMLDRVRSVLGLTGTPYANGHEALYGMCKAIYQDDNPLGPTVTQFRESHYNQHPRRRYLRTIKAGAKAAIEEQLTGYLLCQRSCDYLDLPPIEYVDIRVKLPPALRRQYETLKADLYARLDNGTVEAVNAAVLVNKLLQFTSGRIFDDERNVVDIHTLKADAIAKIREQTLLVMRSYTHTEVPGATAFSPELVDRWNRREIPILIGHPKSLGIGLNLQPGGSAMCWHTLSWSHTDTIQSEARLWRTGQQDPVTVYRVLIADTIDEAVVEVLKSKLRDSDGLMLALKYARQL